MKHKPAEELSKIRRTGFTLVELLIVIVIVAILAAITVVAFNGIQNRAQASSSQAKVRQAFNAIVSDFIARGEIYPTNIKSLNSVIGDANGLQYRVSNVDPQKSFCVDSTIQNISFHMTNNSSKPESGICPNLVSNSGLELNTTGWNFGSNNISSISNAEPYLGLGFLRTIYANTTANTAGNWYPDIPVTVNTSYTGTMYIRSNNPVSIVAILEWKNSTNNIIATSESPVTTLQPNTWTYFVATGVAPPNTASATITWQRRGGITWPAGSTLDLDNVFVIPTSS